jgi:uncharacterized protein (PEP-CTERM system associated)
MAMVTAMVMAMGIDRDGAPQRRAHQRFGTIVPRLTAVAKRWQPGRAAAAATSIALSLAVPSADAQTYGQGQTLGQTLGQAQFQTDAQTPTQGRGGTVFGASVGVTETLTNNVNLSPSSTAQSDWVSEITPSVSIDYRSAHSSLRGFISTPIVLYARTGSENNTIYANGDITGTFEALDRFFFIEAEASASQQFFTPFGATPVGLSNATNNRYTSVSYRISPYIQGVTGRNISYLLRLNAVWGNLNGAPIDVSNSNYTEWIGNLASPVAPWGWAADFNRIDVKFNNQRPQITQLVRLRLIDQLDPQLRMSVSIGYEDNQYPLSDYRDTIYGIGGEWRPTDRTSLVAGWEHRFFGASYLFTFDHRMPQSVLNVNFSRNITSYTQQLGALPAGGNVSGLLNDLLTTRIPDPTQRQTAVNQLISERGLPQVLGSPVNLYTQQILLQENASVSIGLLGVKSAIFLTAFNQRNEPISGSGNVLPPLLSFGNNNTQRGAGITWSYGLTPYTSLVTSAGIGKTVSNSGPAVSTEDLFVRVGMNWKVSPLTTVTAGARYQAQNADVQGDYNEAAVFAGFAYTFR